MVNLLGTGEAWLDESSLRAALNGTPGYVHIYGKAENRLGRKMGHVTAVGATVQEALDTARATACRLKL
jgi:5-(carboxyamino)imidazole ribonucleotide synthase